MIESKTFLNECKKAGYNLFTGTPCSYLKPFINTVIDDADLDFIETTNEGDAVGLASGAWLGGRKAVVMFQNSGLGNAVNPLTSLSYTMKIPFIGIVTLRGEPGGPSDEPQHELMGKITTALLDTMEIPWAYFPTEKDQVEKSFAHAASVCEEKKTPFYFVMRKASVEAYELKDKGGEKLIRHYDTKIDQNLKGAISLTRTDALKVIKKHFPLSTAIVATTGKTGRELFEIEDSSNQLYMVGSMGCALPIALGLSRTNFKNPICAIDGDGSLLMRLGNMALAGQMRPKKLTHILLDNGVHDSTGGQRSFSEFTDFCTIAKACGYEEIYEVDSDEAFERALKSATASNKLTFLRVLTTPGSPKDLGRPTVTPAEVATRMKSYISENI